MKIVVAPQAFKGSLSAWEAARAIERGIKCACPSAPIIVHPIADGGDGTLEICMALTNSRLHYSVVQDSRRQRKKAAWSVLPGDIVLIESARICGLARLPLLHRNPLLTSTCGIGEVIRLALNKGFRRFILGIGGTATHDGGTGMACALGARFLDRQGKEIEPNGGSLHRLHKIDLKRLDPRLAEAEIFAACDVGNSLLGPEGAAKVYALQKGADRPMVLQLEKSMQRLCKVIEKQTGQHVHCMPYGGAGGGLGIGAHFFLGAQLCQGAELIMGLTGFEKTLKEAALLIVGEGRLDLQTSYGKALHFAASAASKRQIPVVALVGQIAPDYTSCVELIQAIIPLSFYPTDSFPIKKASDYLARAAEEVIRLMQLGF